MDNRKGVWIPAGLYFHVCDNEEKLSIIEMILLRNIIVLNLMKNHILINLLVQHIKKIVIMIKK